MEKSISIRKLCYLGLFCAISLILSYVETLIPFHIGIPGAKIGLANIVSIMILFCYGFKESFCVMILRVLITGIVFTNAYMMIYSIAGGVLSIVMMYLFYRTHLFSKFIVSIVGGISHNIGQLLVAMFFFSTSTFIYYLPYLLILGTATGAIIGIIADMMYQKVGHYIIEQK